MDGSVAVARSSLGLLVLELRTEESLLCMQRDSEVMVAIMIRGCVTLDAGSDGVCYVMG